MKKSVILIIGVIYLASVLIVGLMGIQMKIYNPVVYIEEIYYSPQGKKSDKLSNEDFDAYGAVTSWQENVYKQQILDENNSVKYEVGDVSILGFFQENKTIELQFTFAPVNATVNKLDYDINPDLFYKINGEIVTDKNQTPKEGDTVEGFVIYTKNSDGNVVLIFKRAGVVDVYAHPADKPDPKVKISITTFKF